MKITDANGNELNNVDREPYPDEFVVWAATYYTVKGDNIVVTEEDENGLWSAFDVWKYLKGQER